MLEHLPFPRLPEKLPTVLSREEVGGLLAASANRLHRTMLMTLYSLHPWDAWIRRFNCGLLPPPNQTNPRLVAPCIAGVRYRGPYLTCKCYLRNLFLRKQLVLVFSVECSRSSLGCIRFSTIPPWRCFFDEFDILPCLRAFVRKGSGLGAVLLFFCTLWSLVLNFAAVVASSLSAYLTFSFRADASDPRCCRYAIFRSGACGPTCRRRLLSLARGWSAAGSTVVCLAAIRGEHCEVLSTDLRLVCRSPTNFVCWFGRLRLRSGIAYPLSPIFLL